MFKKTERMFAIIAKNVSHNMYLQQKIFIVFQSD